MRTITLALILAVISASASAQGGWYNQRFGNQTYTSGTGQNQGWYGNSQDFGNLTYHNLNGPNGQHQNCTTQRFGTLAYTNCN